MPELNVMDINGQKAASITLPERQFGVHVQEALIHQSLVMYQANNRHGTASTKTRKDVSGGGKKPWAQKGTGRSRQGSTRSPLWKKGGIIFGPHPRDFGYQVPKKIRVAALRESLNAKFLDNTMLCVEALEVASGKTKEFAHILKNLKVQGRTLAVIDGSTEKTWLASRNIARVTLARACDVNAADVMNHKNVLVTKEALMVLLKRIE